MAVQMETNLSNSINILKPNWFSCRPSKILAPKRPIHDFVLFPKNCIGWEMKQNNRLLILGIGALAREVKEIAEDLLDYDAAGFVINEPPFESNSKILGIPIYWIDELENFSKDFTVICALARMCKITIIERVNEFGFNFCNFIHPDACLSRSVTSGS